MTENELIDRFIKTVRDNGFSYTSQIRNGRVTTLRVYRDIDVIGNWILQFDFKAKVIYLDIFKQKFGYGNITSANIPVDDVQDIEPLVNTIMAAERLLVDQKVLDKHRGKINGQNRQ